MSESLETRRSSWFDFVPRFLTNRWVYHVLIWVALFLVFVLIEPKDKGLRYAIMTEGLNICFYAILVYFNLFYLVPLFLKKQRYAWYFIAVGLTVFLITQFKTLVFYFKYAGIPKAQNDLQSEQIYYYLLHLLLVGFSTTLAITRDWLRHQNERIELENKTMQTELQYLKAQINPHFLFNSLNSIYALTLKKSDHAPDMVLKLSEMMRYMLYECNEMKVPVFKEIKYLQNYLDLERIRQGHHVDIAFRLTGDIKDQNIAPLLLIPFIENAFKHGPNTGVDDPFVHIDMELNDDLFTFNIKNNTKEQERQMWPGKKSGGIGLVNAKRRLNILYPDKHDITTDKVDNIYKVQLEIDLTE